MIVNRSQFLSCLVGSFSVQIITSKYWESQIVLLFFKEQTIKPPTSFEWIAIMSGKRWSSGKCWQCFSSAPMYYGKIRTFMMADSWWIYCVYTQIYSSKTTWPKNWPKPLRPQEMAKSLRQRRSRPTSSFQSKGQSLQKWENHRKLGQNWLYYRYYAPIDD